MTRSLSFNAVSFYAAHAPDPEIDAVLARHHALMRSQSPAESCHVMTSGELRQAGARVYGAAQSGKVVAVGAYKQLSDTHIEIKSMHTVSEARGQGIGRKMLLKLLAEGQARGATDAYLETGSYEAFAPARALYETVGFKVVGPFGSYREDPMSTFMHRAL